MSKKAHVHVARSMRPTVVPMTYLRPSVHGRPRRAARTICGTQIDE
jgi:hypothetical protein